MSRSKMLFAFTVLTVAICSSVSYALNNGLGRTPPMGFNTWNWFQCGNSRGQINEALIKSIADAFLTGNPSLYSAGYRYVNIDDCWANRNRDGRGGLITTDKFPKGMKELADYVHGKGLKLGLYSDVAGLTCAQTMPGMAGHEQQDADTFQAWGIDYVKVDWCSGSGSAENAYGRIRDVLRNSVTRITGGKEIFHSICNWGQGSPWIWGPKTGNAWRTTGDINNGNIWDLLESNVNLYSYPGPGGWNDPDMLEVGNGNSPTSDSSHFAIWCMLAAPLLCGNDIRNMSATTRGILTNPGCISLNQDSLGRQAQRVSNRGYQVWVKLLSDSTKGDYAVAFFNKNNSGREGITRTLMAKVGGNIATSKDTFTVRNVWKNKDSIIGTWLPSAEETWYPPTAPGNFATGVYKFCYPRPPINSIANSSFSTVRVKGMLVQRASENVEITTGKSGSFLISMVNLKGALMYANRVTGQQKCTISTAGMKRGIYFINVQSGNGRNVHQVILK